MSRYQGFSPANSKNVIQRQWSDYNPVTSCTDSKLRCNGGTSATESATAAPGDTITAIWQQWTHSQGPVIDWMYKCSGAFSSCDGSGSGWFKIDEGGFHGDGTKVFLDTETPSGWDIAKLVGGNKPWSSKVPANLAPGNYLVRHELIALHQANSPQFYPECAQVVITGSGSAQPDSSYKAAIPGYCNQNDANIKVSPFSEGEKRDRRSSCADCLSGPHQRPQQAADLQGPRPARVDWRLSAGKLVEFLLGSDA